MASNPSSRFPPTREDRDLPSWARPLGLLNLQTRHFLRMVARRRPQLPVLRHPHQKQLLARPPTPPRVAQQWELRECLQHRHQAIQKRPLRPPLALGPHPLPTLALAQQPPPLVQEQQPPPPLALAQQPPPPLVQGQQPPPPLVQGQQPPPPLAQGQQPPPPLAQGQQP